MSRGTTDFNEARVGTAVLEVCEACGLNTGTVLIKTKGDTETEYTGPCRLRNRGARCEFCEFLGLWMAHEGHDPQKDGKVGASKIVERQEDGTEKLVAYVSFIEGEDRDNNLADSTKFQFQHGMVIRAEREEGNTMKLVEIIQEGT